MATRTSAAAAAAAAAALALALALATLPAPAAATPATAAAPAAARNETGDEILDRILEDVFKDVPAPRAGVGRTTWVVAGSATASWSSYTSFADGSFGGGVSEFFGAGGSVSMQGTSAGEALNRYNSLHPGFGSSGSWLTQPRQDRRSAAPSGRRVDQRSLMTQLWASAVLRDNLVTVFGYVLNVPDSPLSTELYTSLYHVYDAVRLRRVQTFELIRAVQDLAGANPNDQFLVTFRALRRIVPRYLQSAVSVWIDACRKNLTLLNELLRPGGGPLVVDFLAGIDSSVIGLLADELEWDHAAPKEQPKARELLGGSVFEDVFTALGEGTLELTQELFAVLLVNRPSNGVAAEKDETERYLVDVLRLGNVRHWDKIVRGVTPEDKEDPERLIATLLRLIAESKETEAKVREDARYLRPYMTPPTVTYANKYYKVISGVISNPSIDILSMLKAITPKEYPLYIVKVKNRIVNYILDGQLNVEFITKGFNRFDHVTPVNILIALLTRVTRRLPQLPRPIQQSVKTLQLFLLYKQFLCTMSSKIPVNLLDVSTITSAYDDPSVPQNVTDLVNELALTLPEEKVAWDLVSEKISLHRCVRPRQCIYSYLCLIVNKKYLPKGRSTFIIRKLLKLLDRDGNPKVKGPSPKHPTTEVFLPPEINTTVLVDGNYSLPVSSSVLINAPPWTATPEPRRMTTLIAMTTVESVEGGTDSWRRSILDPDELFMMEVEDAVRRAKTAPFPPLSAVQQEEPALVQYPATCLPATVNGSVENSKMLPAHMLLSWDRLPRLLGEDFHFEHYVKKGELLLALMEGISKLDIVQRNEEVSLYVQSYLQFIYSFRRTFSAESVIHFPSLLNALPVVKTDLERQYVAKIKNYFAKPDFYKQLGPRFDSRLHKTRGQMLKYVLTLMSSLPMVKWDPILKKSIDHYVDKVYTDGYGAQEVEWALVSEASEPTYVDMSVFRVLDHREMPQDALVAEYEIIRFIFTEFIPNVHLRDLNVKKFKTKGQFLKGTFEYLLQQESVHPRIKEDIRMLMQYIRMNGRGAEPLDYNADSFM